MENFDYVWEKTIKIFPILNKSLADAEYNERDLEIVFLELLRLEIVENVYETIFLEIDNMLRQTTAPNFWKYFKECSNRENEFFQFQLAVYELDKEYNQFINIIKLLEILKQKCNLKNVFYAKRDDINVFNDMLKVSLLSQLPANFNNIAYSFYHLSFKVFVNSHQSLINDENIEIDDMEIKCSGCDMETENCRCQELVYAFNSTNQILTHMKLLDRLAGYTLTKLIQNRITLYVQETCKGIFDVSHIKRLEKWLETIVLNWLIRIYNKGSLKIPDNNTIEFIEDFKIKLSYYLYETYANTIIDQFFNIIIDYPESEPVIDDLKICLKKLDRRSHLINTLKRALETRLLHPGVNTSDILTGYVAAIKAIRHLDTSGNAMLESVIEPVKQYMRNRPDTVRCVVTALTEDGPTDLAEELAKSEAIEDDATLFLKGLLDWNLWQPDPIDANPKKSSRTTRVADIISMVVDIYGSKELFVNEYRSLLADRLLLHLNFNPEKEIRNLELLKLRFGEGLLHNCEVMLKDISDSKRINSHIHNDTDYANESKFEISSLILSSQFWPPFKNESLELPQIIEDEFNKFTKSYKAYKGNRTLCWRSVIGCVKLELDMENGRKIEAVVTPTLAALIYKFQEKSEWYAEELSQQLKVPLSVLRKRIPYWINLGVIQEKKNGILALVEDPTGNSDNSHLQMTQECDEEDEESESVMASASDQREEELQVFWSYIVGMLTNLDSLPLERIHQMLKMFASHGPGVEFTQEELKNFLQRKVRENELTFTGGVYHLPK